MDTTNTATRETRRRISTAEGTILRRCEIQNAPNIAIDNQPIIELHAQKDDLIYR